MKLSYSDLKFLEKTKKLKKSYEKGQNLVGDEFDVNNRQAPLKTFNKVNREKNKNYKYKFFAHKRKIYSFLPIANAGRLEEKVIEINDYEENKAIV